jgi:hypothetical protein
MSTPTAKHWSGVDAGEQFTVELDYDGTPCTNRPVTCPVCQMYGWSYNMAAHVETGACCAVKGSAALAGYAPQHHELEWLQPFLKNIRRPHSSHALLSGAHASLPTAVRISEPM